MELSLTAGALRDALATARHATPATPGLVAYSGVLLALKGSNLTATGSDGETTITAAVKVTGTTDGQALLPPKPILAYLATLDPATTIALTATDGDVSVQPEGSQPYSFRTLTSTFPLPSGTRTQATPAALERLGAALHAVAASVAKDNPGVQVISSDAGLVLHSTDNYRLTRAVLPEAGFGEFSGVLPLPALERIARHGVKGLVASDKMVRAEGDSVTITTRLLSTPFPAVDSLLSAVPPQHAVVPAAALRAALSRLASVADTAPLKVEIADEELVLTVSNADLGSGVERITLAEAATAEVSFSARLSYLLDAVGSHTAEQVEIGWTTAVAPVFIRSQEPFPVTSLVMPIRS